MKFMSVVPEGYFLQRPQPEDSERARVIKTLGRFCFACFAWMTIFAIASPVIMGIVRLLTP